MSANYKGVTETNLGTFTFANLPAIASTSKGDTCFCSNALKAAETTGLGSGNMLFSDGSNWIRVDTGTVAAS